MDFYKIKERQEKGVTIVYPAFIVKRDLDILVRGGEFLAFFDNESGLWIKDKFSLYEKIDSDMRQYVESKYDRTVPVKILTMSDCSNNSILDFGKYTKMQLPNTNIQIDCSLTFLSDIPKRKDYATKKLPYDLSNNKTPNWDKILNTLYNPDEAKKIEWAIGSIVSGDSITNQKMFVFFGAPGTGKSTILNIIEMLFEGYTSTFSAKELGSGKNNFATGWLSSNPLVAIQHDGDLFKLIDNTILNQIVSHEPIEVNEKFKQTFVVKPLATLFMGTNRPVQITDARAGLLRRLVDIHPSNNKLSPDEYNRCMDAIQFELGSIAQQCLNVYISNKHLYDSYRPLSMMSSTNDIFDFLSENIMLIRKQNGDASLKQLYDLYKSYCDESNTTAVSKKMFKFDVSAYFQSFSEHVRKDGERQYNVFRGFKEEMILGQKKSNPDDISIIEQNGIKYPNWLILDNESNDTPLDILCKNKKAQLAINENGHERPMYKWDNCKTVLADISNKEVHYVKVPEQLIVIDFDLKDSNGEKSIEKNLEAAMIFPETYAELSKSGLGLHLHYIYDGDVSKLSRIFENDIEVKVFTGNSSLRRKLTKHNNIQIAHINSGLPLKEDCDKMLDKSIINNEKQIRTLIKRNLMKEYHSYTAPSVQFIFKILDDAYLSGIEYDVSDLYQAVNNFAMKSSHQADLCLELVAKMHFKSDHDSIVRDISETNIKYDKDSIIFYDVEVFPNLFVVCYKIAGDDNKVVKLINPKPNEIEVLTNSKLIGFNNKNYDDHILYARILGYDEEQLYSLSKKIIDSEKGSKDNGKFREAYNLSYTDIYDYSVKKQSLKKWEIELGISHIENAFPWNEPVDEKNWNVIAEYCANDVIATEKVFEHTKGDFTARQILAELADGNVGMSTNSLSTKFIFSGNRTPQNEFLYRNLAEPVTSMDDHEDALIFLKKHFPDMLSKKHGNANSILPYFPGYEFNQFAKTTKEKSTYLGYNVGEGGYASGVPGIYWNVALLDVASMHPHSCMAECFFGPRYTQKYWEIVNSRILIKHKEYDKLPEFLQKYVPKIESGEISNKDLSNALKICINSVYGLTSASFPNPFKLDENIDNIIAKRGSLFMLNLREEVQKRGFKVAHIKTDSIKIPDATPEIINFVVEYGKEYGYTFEHECTYDRMCLLNDAVYICKYATEEQCKALYGYAPGDNISSGGSWHATGTEFQEPYIFKKLFSKEDIVFNDLRCTKEVKSPAAMYIDLNSKLPDVSDLENQLIKLDRKLKGNKITQEEYDIIHEKLTADISKGHAYKFIGRVGSFVPVTKECDCGGPLVRSKDNQKYDSVTGCKGYRFAEADIIESIPDFKDVDYSYYNKLLDDAIADISALGDFENFIS